LAPVVFYILPRFQNRGILGRGQKGWLLVKCFSASGHAWTEACSTQRCSALETLKPFLWNGIAADSWRPSTKFNKTLNAARGSMHGGFSRRKLLLRCLCLIRINDTIDLLRPHPPWPHALLLPLHSRNKYHPSTPSKQTHQSRNTKVQIQRKKHRGLEAMHVRESIWERTSEYSGFSSEPEDGVSSESAKEKRKKLEHVKNCKGETKRDRVEKNQLGNLLQ